jgi:hypothetical protein
MSDTVLVVIAQQFTQLERLKVFEALCCSSGADPITDVGVRPVLQGCPQLREDLAERCNLTQMDWTRRRDESDALAQGVCQVCPKLVSVTCDQCVRSTSCT